MNIKIIDKYKQAGVNVEKADRIVEEIKNISQQSHENHVLPIPLGGFAAAYEIPFKSFKKPIILASTDGVGTKILLAKETSLWDGIGQDVVAMCLNDLICHGGQPLFFLDYISCSSLNIEITKKIILGITKACTTCGCALIGGETAELPGLIMKNNFDVAGFSIGIVEAENIWKADRVNAGDVLLGLAANGIHSNGYSLLRNVFKQAKVDLTTNLKINNMETKKSVAEMFLQPTRLYVPSLKALGNKYNNFGKDSSYNPIHAVANITGGGIIGNVKRIIPNDLQAVINTDAWSRPAIYSWIESISQSCNTMQLQEKDMWSVWNMGIGMVLSVAKDVADEIENELQNLNEEVFRIGKVKRKTNQNDASAVLQFV